MKIKNSQFRKKAIACSLAFVFQPTMLLAQVDSNSVAQDNINRAVQAPKAQAEFALPTKQVGQPTFVLPDLGDSSSASLSPVDERKLGQEIMREIRRDPDYSNDTVFSDYLNGLAQQLVGPARQLGLSGFEGAGSFSLSFELFGVRDKSINAFALPGGYIGVHTGLIVAAETESELASVLGHEMGHVSQKHIARMYSKEGTNSMIALASIVLAILAARNNPNAAQGLAVGGQALAIQNQLSYSRDAEREADRVGFQILQASGFDVQGMPDFFQRMQRANSIMENGVPGYLRTHPLTTDRIADMQDRVRGLAVRKVPSSIEFYLLKARARLIQTSSSSNYPELRQFNESLTHKTDLSKQLEGYYGLTLLNMKQERWADAENNLQKTKNILQAMSAAGSPVKKWSLAVEATSIDLMVAHGQYEAAIKELNLLKSAYPNSRTFNLQTINIELKLKQYEPAIAWMKTQLRANPDDAVLWDLLAKAYNLTGKKALQYAALAEKYVSGGAWIAAIEQMRLAKEAGDADFYQASEIEARARQIQEMYRQELREKGKKQ
jgi:predicted Zn-dependent protease